MLWEKFGFWGPGSVWNCKRGSVFVCVCVLPLTLPVEEQGGSLLLEGQAWPLWRGVVFPTGRESKRQLPVPTNLLLWASDTVLVKQDLCSVVWQAGGHYWNFGGEGPEVTWASPGGSRKPLLRPLRNTRPRFVIHLPPCSPLCYSRPQASGSGLRGRNQLSSLQNQKLGWMSHGGISPTP